MISRTLPRSIFCLLIIFFLVIGCAQAPQTGQPGGPAPAVIEVWHSLLGAQADALQAQTEAIMKAHPEVIVKLKYIPEEKFASFSYQAEAGGEGPEIFIARREVIRQLYSQGTLAKTAYSDQGSFSAASAGFRFGDTQYALPWLTDVPLLYYRTDMVSTPSTLDSLFSSQGGTSVLAADTGTLSAWWNGQGGKLMNAGKPSLDDPSNLAFLQKLIAWQSAKTLRIDPQAMSAFANGQTPYVIAGASQAALLNQQKVPWGCIPLADLTGGQGEPLLGLTFGIANSAIMTKDLGPEIQIVEKGLLQPEAEGALVKAGSLLPANMAYYKLPEAQTGVYPQAYQAFAKAWVLSGSAQEWNLISLQDTAWSSALAGSLSPQDALTNAQTQALKALTKSS
ncbi:maltose ABC transporter periplasmic protein [Desulfosporosinus acididurans]|uniref:Maltose ABC transporter periplasmic protein n=1 Tax=Desulfosporosinus acididurans TaxID=476652 RepID=A0A0J1FVN1_9FIRM|nr:extracellular solute-binding protein [Desulfosporosinus acididurans]KLU67013.1 maltose ABC transporter periplasmic protein [Desulfosporosinus acididurans]